MCTQVRYLSYCPSTMLSSPIGFEHVDSDLARRLNALRPSSWSRIISVLYFQRRGFGLWAVEVISGAPFIGFIGLSVPSFDAPFTPWSILATSWF